MANEQGTYSIFKSGVNNSTLIPFPDFNETIYFGGDSGNYKELVYTSRIKDTLNLSIEILTNDSETSRLALRNEKKKKKGIEIEIPRPQNAWIIYRRDKYLDPEFEGIKSCIASVKIGKKWRSENNEVVKYFVALSMLALENHQKKYGNYKYQPKSKASKKSMYRQRQQRKENKSSPETMISTFTEETTLNQDLPQFVVNPPSPYLPTPVSSIQHSPANDFLEQANENSYLLTPASSNNQSPVISDLLTPESLNQHTPITSEDIMNSGINPIAMYPELTAIIPTNDFYNNSLAVSEYVLKFLYDADMLASLQSSTDVTYNTEMVPDMSFNNDVPATPAPDMTFNNDVPATPAPDMTFNSDIPATLETLHEMIYNSDIQATTNMNDQIEDFYLYSDNDESEELISNITPLAAETMTTSMEDQLFQELFEYDSNDLFSINATPSLDQFDFYDNNNSPSF